MSLLLNLESLEMRTFFLFCLVCFIGSGALLVGTTMDEPGIAFVVGFGVWLLFMYWFINRKR